ncbi:MAG TPA: hypothetical protein VGH48_17355, partial [Caldimonas sp.]
MAATPAPPEPAWRDVVRRFAWRGLRGEAVTLGFAAFLWALFPQGFWETVLYSLCISTMCWLFIEVGRAAVAGHRPSLVPGERRSGWPGWSWMLVIVAGGGILGYAAGNAIANALTGNHAPGPFDAEPRQMLALLLMALVPALTITYFFQSRAVIARQREQVE